MADWTISINPESGTSGTTNLTIASSGYEEDNTLAVIELCNTEKDISEYVLIGNDEEKFNVNYLDCLYTGQSVNLLSYNVSGSGVGILAENTSITGYSIDSGQTILPIPFDRVHFGTPIEFGEDGLHNVRLYMEGNSDSIKSYDFTTSDLYSIVLPSFITRIESNAFGIPSVDTLPQTTRPKLARIEYSNHLKYISDCAFKQTPLEGALYLSPSIEYVGDKAFWGVSVSSATIYAKELGNYCMAHSAIEKLYLGPTVNKINDDCFAGSPIKEIIFTEGLEYIGDEAFFDCYISNRIVIPCTLTYLGRDVFKAYTNLHILFPGYWVGKGSRCLIPKKNYFDNNPDYSEGMQYFDVEVPYGVACLKSDFFNYRPISLLNVPKEIALLSEQVKISLANSYLGTNRSPLEAGVPTGETVMNLLRTTYHEYAENQSHKPYSVFKQYFTVICDFAVPDNFNPYIPTWGNPAYYDGIIFLETTVSLGHNVCNVPKLICSYAATAPTIQSDSFVGNGGTVVLQYPVYSDYSSWVEDLTNKGYTVIEENIL